MNIDQELISWLLTGDVSIQYQVYRDLLGNDLPELRERISTEGWGAKYLSFRHEKGHWGTKFFHPKWTSSNYSILDLKNFNIDPNNKLIKASINQIVKMHKGPDGGILPIGSKQLSDGCINGMFLNYASYFGIEEKNLRTVVDCILLEHMGDGGYNCRSNRGGAVHSSLHTTITILEGILEYYKNGYKYRLKELLETAEKSQEFILQHQLFKSDRTGEIIDKRMTMLSYPSRWHYDILRALDYFQSAEVRYDPRMNDALEVLLKKRKKNDRWPVQAKHPGVMHFEMEKTGGDSRWNTLRAMRVLNHFN